MFLLGFSFVFVIIVVFVSNQILQMHGIWCVTLLMGYAHSVAVSGSGIVTFFVLSRIEYYKRAKEECWKCCRSESEEEYDNYNYRTIDDEENDEHDEYDEDEALPLE